MYAGCVIKNPTRRTYSVADNHCGFNIIETAEKISPLLLTNAIPLYFIALLFLFVLIPKAISSEHTIVAIDRHPKLSRRDRA